MAKKDFQIYINDEEFRNGVDHNIWFSPQKLLDEQVNELSNYSKDVYGMVSECFTSVSRAALLLSANGLFLKYAGPTIRNNYQLVKIAVNQNGGALRYASRELLMSDPMIAADLILSVNYGYPCEEFRKVVDDADYIFEVSKRIVERDPFMLEWVCKKMYRVSVGSEKYQRISEALSSSIKKR